MALLHKVNPNRCFFPAVAMLLSLLSLNSFSTPVDKIHFHKILTPVIHSLEQLPPDSSAVSDTIRYRKSKDSLSAPVKYHADDSLVIDVPGKKMILYGKESTVKYQDNELSGPVIKYDQSTSQVSTFLVKDSTGAVVSHPVFIQGGMKSVSDTIFYNMKTMKGITKGTYTQEGEMFVYSEKFKKVSDDVFYGGKTRFTTCNLDTPHFAFVTNKVKFISGDMAVSGLVYPEVEGVPLPIGLPFGFYPLSSGRHSGILAPSFTANDQLGLSLDGLGYYKVINDNWDVILRGTIYSYGGWSFSLNPRYYKRYRYQGNFSFDMQRFITGFKDDPDYSSSRTINIRWTHTADVKARPGVSFSANVNAGSSKFNQQVPNNPTLNFTNQLNSSITFAKVWKDKPYNISISANHNQNTQQRLINLNLPDVNFNLNTLYPFRRAEPIGQYKWYENIGVALNSNARSLTSFYDTAGNIGKQIADRWQWGANHNIPITLSLPPMGFIQLSPGVTYSQRWYQKKMFKSWNDATDKLDTTINKGFFMAQDMSFSVNMTTRIFGMFTFGPRGRLQAIRHEIRPFISASYRPDFNKQNYYTTQIDTFGNTGRFSVFEGSVFGQYGEGRFGGLSFGIDNNLQMKVRNKRDTSASSMKKVSLIDGFGINGSYNFLQDSFQLSNLNMNLRSNLFEKINITGSAVFDPYLYDDVTGRRLDKLVWSDKLLSLGTLTGGSVALSSSFRGGEGRSGGSSVVPGPSFSNPAMADEMQQEMNNVAENPAQYVDFNIPWNIDLSYSLRFSRLRTGTGFTTQLSQDINWNSSLNITPRWKLGVTGFYNITQKELGTLSLYMSRELHCWQMAITVSPVGLFKYFSINISPRSGILQDLKVNRTRYFYAF